MAILRGRAGLWILTAGSGLWAGSLQARGPLTDTASIYWMHTVYLTLSEAFHIATTPLSLHPHSWGRYDHHPIYSLGNRVWKRLSEPPKVTQLVNEQSWDLNPGWLTPEFSLPLVYLEVWCGRIWTETSFHCSSIIWRREASPVKSQNRH